MLLGEISLLLGKRLIIRVTTLAQINELLQGIDPHAKEIAGQPSDQPPGPSAPDAPVCAPKSPDHIHGQMLQGLFLEKTSKTAKRSRSSIDGRIERGEGG